MFLSTVSMANAQISFPLSMFKDRLHASSEEIDDQIKKASIEKLNAIIEKNRPKVESGTADKSFKQNLAACLIQKSLLLKQSPYQNLEEFFTEADSLLPNNYYIESTWGDVLLNNQKYDEALSHYNSALSDNDPQLKITPEFYMKAGFSAINAMQYNSAAEYFDKAINMEPGNFHAYFGAGMSYYELKSYEEANERLETALELAKPYEKKYVEALLSKIKEFLASTENSDTDEDQRFVVHFAGNSKDDLGDITFDILDDIYFQVTDSLNFHPDVKINIVFFLTEDYYKMGKDWSAASAQGIQIMVPLKSGYKSQEYVKGLLAHEFTHTIIHLKSKNKCPLWLNEGLAQYQEFTASYGSPDQIRPDFERVMNDEFINGEGYLSLNKAQAMISTSQDHGNVSRGYIASYMATRCLADLYGENSFDEILSKLGEGKSFNEAMMDSIGRTQSEFEEEYADWLKSQ